MGNVPHGTLGEGMLKSCRLTGIARLLRVTSGVAMVGLVVCAGTTLARAGDDDSDSSNTSFYDSFLKVIGVEGGPDIQYGERSPLVVPPTRDLPPPMANQAPAVPDWPKDPDMTRQKRAKVQEKRKPQPDYVLDSSRPLSPAELKVPGPLPTSTGGRAPDADPEAQPVTPAVTQRGNRNLFSFDNIFNHNKPEYATFTGEPQRANLTDPPPGYLTPSPDQPYGVGPEHKKYEVPTVATRAAGDVR